MVASSRISWIVGRRILRKIRQLSGFVHAISEAAHEPCSKRSDFDAFLAGTVPAVEAGTVRSGQSVWSAPVLMFAIITAAIVPAFAGQAHPVCTVKHHDCGEAPTIRSCCCGDQDTASNQGGPVESKVQLTAPSMTVVADLTFVAPSDIVRPHDRPYSGTTRAAPLDLPTLFASLLI